MLNNLEYKLVSLPDKPKLTMRYYKAKNPQKGIIMFVHGVSHGAWCWEKFAKFFTLKGYDCFAVNLRNHGENNKKGAFFKFHTLKTYLKDVKRFIDYCPTYCKNNGIQYSKPFLLGHSMGGAIVEKYISNYSNEVRAAILLASVTARGMGILKVLYNTFSRRGRNTFPTVLGSKMLCKLWCKILEVIFHKNISPLDILSKSNFFGVKIDNEIISRITDNKELEYYDEHLCSESILAMFGLICFKLKKPNIPVFVIGSDTDAYFPEDSLNITADFYDTKAEIIEGACHDIMLEPKCEEAAKSILEFLKNPNDSKCTSSK